MDLLPRHRLRDQPGEGLLSVPLNTAVMFGKATDEWETPQAFFDKLDEEFGFAVDVAATKENAKCAGYFGRNGLEEDALTADWGRALWAVEDGSKRSAFWMNPPYSRCREFMARASLAACGGHTVVALVPSRTDTRWWHEHVYYGGGLWWPSVEVRFVKGRLKFGNSTNSAPFPSVVVIFRPEAISETGRR